LESYLEVSIFAAISWSNTGVMEQTRRLQPKKAKIAFLKRLYYDGTCASACSRGALISSVGNRRLFEHENMLPADTKLMH
jgi:hypothetical protein